MSSESESDAYKIARSVFEQTWSDYYAWNPPFHLPLAMTNIVVSEDDESEDPSLAFFKHLDDITSTTLDHPSHNAELARSPREPFVQRVKTTTRFNIQAALGTFALEAKIELLPQYSFVNPTVENIVVPEAHKCPFIPILSDDAPFDEAEYLREFDGKRTISDMGRDATGECTFWCG